jgi:hypothetical protein
MVILKKKVFFSFPGRADLFINQTMATENSLHLSLHETSVVKNDQFCKIFKNMKLFNEKVNVVFDETRLYLQAMDRSNVSITELSIPAQWFDEYTVQGSCTLGMNTNIVHTILSIREEEQQKTILAFSDTRSDVVSIHFVNATPTLSLPMASSLPTEEASSQVTKRKKAKTASEAVKKPTGVFDKSFEVPLYGIDAESFAIPPMDHEVEISFQSSIFFSTIAQLRKFGDVVHMHFDETAIVFVAKSPEAGEMRIVIKMEDIESFSIVENGNMDITLSLPYLYNMASFHELSKIVYLHVSPDSPLKMSYELGTNAYMDFYLAPKLEDP